MNRLRNYHAAKWDEPLILEMGAPGERDTSRQRSNRGFAEPSAIHGR